MVPLEFILTPSALVPITNVLHVDVTRLEECLITVHYVMPEMGGVSEEIRGVQAIDALMRLYPAAIEGRRMRWPRRAWALHNLIAHPVMQLLAFAKLYKAAMWVHDVTVPRPRSEE